MLDGINIISKIPLPQSTILSTGHSDIHWVNLLHIRVYWIRP